jgi:hypothetical protein
MMGEFRLAHNLAIVSLSRSQDIGLLQELHPHSLESIEK